MDNTREKSTKIPKIHIYQIISKLLFSAPKKQIIMKYKKNCYFRIRIRYSRNGSEDPYPNYTDPKH